MKRNYEGIITWEHDSLFHCRYADIFVDSKEYPAIIKGLDSKPGKRHTVNFEYGYSYANVLPEEELVIGQLYELFSRGDKVATFCPTNKLQ